MTKTYKAVLKSSLVMLVLFAVAGSGVAQAQECIAQVAKSKMVRAEGITEVVGDIEVAVRAESGRDGFGSEIPARSNSVKLNTNITNTRLAMSASSNSKKATCHSPTKVAE